MTSERGSDQHVRDRVFWAFAVLALSLISSNAHAGADVRAEDALLVSAGRAPIHQFLPGELRLGGPTVITGPTVPLTVEQGSNVEFRNYDFSPHKVASKNLVRGRPLFLSKTLPAFTPPQAVPSTVMVTQHLKPGLYPFYCPLHVDMKGILEVTG